MLPLARTRDQRRAEARAQLGRDQHRDSRHLHPDCRSMLLGSMKEDHPDPPEDRQSRLGEPVTAHRSGPTTHVTCRTTEPQCGNHRRRAELLDVVVDCTVEHGFTLVSWRAPVGRTSTGLAESPRNGVDRRLAAVPRIPPLFDVAARDNPRAVQRQLSNVVSQRRAMEAV